MQKLNYLLHIEGSVSGFFVFLGKREVCSVMTKKSIDALLNHSTSNIETTIGELVEIITNIVLESCISEEEAYRVASIAVNDLLEHYQRP